MTKIHPSLGLSYKALDLHVHSIASEDYQDKSVTPSDIIDAAIDAGLDGICITDHNTANGIDDITNAAKGKSVVVFPGVEISVTGGKDGPIHIIGIFEPGTTTESLNDLLTLVGLTKGKRGKTASIAEGDPNTVITKIAECKGIPVLAHADSSHGVLHDMKGQPRLVVIQNPNLMAAELSNVQHKKLLDGTDPQYQRSLPTYEASDAHNLSQIGTKRTYFRMQDLSIASLRQCFIDPDSRIRNEAQYGRSKAENFPKIEEIVISQGFFEGETTFFHPYQNTLIGGQGVGKSLLVEFVRFALDQMSTIEDIRKDSESKLRAQLGVNGYVKITVVLPNGMKYEIKRIYDGDTNPLQVTNLDTNMPYDGSINILFPIMAYSQTEAIYIARNPNAQLELIDRFIDKFTFEHRLENILAELRRNDLQLAEIADVNERLKAATQDLNTVIENIVNVEKSLESIVLLEMKLADQQKNAFYEQLDYHASLIKCIEEALKRIEIDHKPPTLPEACAFNQLLSNADQLSSVLAAKVSEKLSSLIASIQENKRQVDKCFQTWLPEYTGVENKYKEFLSQIGDDQQSLETKRQALETKKQELEDKVKNLTKKAKELESLIEIREDLLNQLDSATTDLFEARRQKYEELTKASESKLLLDLNRSANIDAFVSALQRIATGTRIRKSDLASLARNISPRKLIDLVWKRDAKSIAQKADIDYENAEKFVNWLNNLEAQEQVWALQHQYMPEDVPSIRFRKADGNYYELSELSVGQKCTALLIIALSAENYPILIDQPEESIDIASVFSDIVSKLRSGKEQRQFVLTTHNPNIAVTADSDLIHILKSSATHGKIVMQGAIEDSKVKHEVIQHLEGGEKPYLLRGKKYGILS